MKYDINLIKGRTIDKGGLIFESPNFLNLVGIRDLSNPNDFNDTLIYYWTDEFGDFNYKEIERFTTDPGLYYLKHLLNSNGCAILSEGWHRKLWKIGLHQGKYKALVQATPVKVYRDGNKNDVIEIDTGIEQTGYFGINLHHASNTGTSIRIDKWSAGCQVIADINDFNDLMYRVQRANDYGQDLFSYMLFDKSEVV